eukprot:1158452-Pelagomonas_calceolata.AAC.1
MTENPSGVPYKHWRDVHCAGKMCKLKWPAAAALTDNPSGVSYKHWRDVHCADKTCKHKWPAAAALTDALRSKFANAACGWIRHRSKSHEKGGACPFTYWDSTLDGQPFPSAYRMALHTPFLIPSSPPGTSSAGAAQQQGHARIADVEHEQGHGEDQGSGDIQEHMAPCELELSLCAPPESRLRGWLGAADAPEDLPDDVKSRSLCLLASLGGQFLGVRVLEESLHQHGERVAKVGASFWQNKLVNGSKALSKILSKLANGTPLGAGLLEEGLHGQGGQ